MPSCTHGPRLSGHSFASGAWVAPLWSPSYGAFISLFGWCLERWPFWSGGSYRCVLCSPHFEAGKEPVVESCGCNCSLSSSTDSWFKSPHLFLTWEGRWETYQRPQLTALWDEDRVPVPPSQLSASSRGTQGFLWLKGSSVQLRRNRNLSSS